MYEICFWRLWVNENLKLDRALVEHFAAHFCQQQEYANAAECDDVLSPMRGEHKYETGAGHQMK